MFAQKTKSVSNVKGEWVLSNELTPVEAREKALNKAKENALKEAGVPEYINSSNLLFKKASEKSQDDLFLSLTTVEVSGAIKKYTVIDQKEQLNDENHLTYSVWIDADVVIYKSKKDPGYQLDVYGLRESFSSPDKLTFSVKPDKNGYLTIFILSENESSLLYPNAIEAQTQLHGGTTYNFPISTNLDYEVSTEEKIEVNYLVLLLTKNEIPFNKNESTDDILRFIAAIDPFQKCLKSYSLIIKN